jgi:hypothetical protein
LTLSTFAFLEPLNCMLERLQAETTWRGSKAQLSAFLCEPSDDPNPTVSKCMRHPKETSRRATLLSPKW